MNYYFCVQLNYMCGRAHELENANTIKKKIYDTFINITNQSPNA